MEREKTVSHCCFAEVRIVNNDATYCTACGEECDMTWPPCPLSICDGSGKQQHLTYDTDMRIFMPDGEEDCLCVKD